MVWTIKKTEIKGYGHFDTYYAPADILISSRDFSFYFNDTKFLWKELMKINTTYILRNKDLSLLEPYVENILYSRLFPDDVDMLSNYYIIQLLK